MYQFHYFRPINDLVEVQLLPSQKGYHWASPGPGRFWDCGLHLLPGLSFVFLSQAAGQSAQGGYCILGTPLASEKPRVLFQSDFLRKYPVLSSVFLSNLFAVFL